ncbi:Leucine-rich repeat transmembrane protein kinase [Euphorbia peplus]|nr:Leucine-rich repeat transmembrane protein kinase [Euphorbia peplus]
MLASIIILLLIFKVEAQAQPPAAAPLPQDEVEVLKEVAAQLGKKDWNFDVNPCSSDVSWVTPPSNDNPLYGNTMLCNCSITASSQCHVESIFLRGQNLAGVLPRAIVKLPYLKKLDLSRNYLSGPIPSEWNATKLEFLVIAINRLTGQIPSSLGNITTLTALSIENNLFSGTLPPEIGNLVNMEILILSANNLTGNLPQSLSNLTKLTQLRISSNNFTGKLPSYIQNWKNIQKLEIQASGLEGPIPSSISALSNLTELRISDLHGEGSEFPRLENMTGITLLMLRNCNISGRIPSYVPSMPNLKILDLSFNRLDGNVSIDLQGLTSLENVYLTSNLLSGPLPDWIKNGDTRADIDLSYNNFSESSMPNTCRDSLNLFRSTSGGNISKPAGCLNNFACSKDRYSLHINCGGGATTVGGITYEADEEAGAAARYVPNKETWEISNTGHFWDKNRSSSDYFAQNSSTLTMNAPALYTRARLSPLSLTYYIRCLGTGNYNVKLHFAEIIFGNGTTFSSLGRRIFDVYIQEKRVLKDFDIVKEARGVDKVVIQTFKAAVTEGTLEIRFHWASKGTTASPRRGIYGPLISAIDVESDFKPPISSEEKRKKLIIAGAVVFPVVLILIIVSILWWKGCLGGREEDERELLGMDLQTGVFTFRQIKAATHNFDPANKLGEGGFGAVYKGTLSDGTIVAVKQLSSKSKQGNREFLNEVGMISALQHPNLVKLYGCCVERNQLVLVYEYMENNSLANALFEDSGLDLDWPTRRKICFGIAKGLAYMHEESALKIVHRDIKTTNILLDKGLNAKISDFGLAKLDEEENTHISTRVAGTIGYMAPEYALWGYLTYKADVYSFGIVALEIVVGKNNMKYRPDENFFCILDWALVLQQKGDLVELLDPRLGSKFNKAEAVKMIKIALLCTNTSPALRPTMSEVVSMLQGKAPIPEFIMGPSMFGIEKLDQSSVQSSSEIASRIHSSVPWTGSSSNNSSV